MHFPHASDHHRAQYHFQAPTNWMNDPNGLVQWNGYYHLFYQYNPHGPLFGLKHWGHARSSNLVHWEHLPIALAPTPGTVDEDGCWSGCFINNDGAATIIYSGNRAGVQVPCIATSSDEDLATWQKYAGNPVIPNKPQDVALTEYRDHCVWQEEGVWYQLIGSGIQDVGGTALLYSSLDLINWTYMHPLCVGDKESTGTMWECPDFFRLGDKYFLTVSSLPDAIVYYFIGSYKDHRFIPETQGILDSNKIFYAPQSIRDTQGRRLMFGWLREGRPNDAIITAGWAGAMSIPYVLSLHDDNTLKVQAAEELTQLRGEHVNYTDLAIQTISTPILNVKTAAVELLAELVPTQETICLTISSTTDPTETITIPLNIGQLTEINQLHIFLDGSILEIFINQREVLTKRVYLPVADSYALGLCTRQGSVQVKQLDIWQLTSIWEK